MRNFMRVLMDFDDMDREMQIENELFMGLQHRANNEPLNQLVQDRQPKFITFVPNQPNDSEMDLTSMEVPFTPFVVKSTDIPL